MGEQLKQLSRRVCSVGRADFRGCSSLRGLTQLFGLTNSESLSRICSVARAALRGLLKFSPPVFYKSSLSFPEISQPASPHTPLSLETTRAMNFLRFWWKISIFHSFSQALVNLPHLLFLHFPLSLITGLSSNHKLTSAKESQKITKGACRTEFPCARRRGLGVTERVL